MICEVCGHSFAQRNRIIPGEIGGDYSAWNVVYLCPNHHEAFHYTLWAACNMNSLTNDHNQHKRNKVVAQFGEYLCDVRFRVFFHSVVTTHLLVLYSVLWQCGVSNIHDISDRTHKMNADSAVEGIIDDVYQWRKSHGIRG